MWVLKDDNKKLVFHAFYDSFLLANATSLFLHLISSYYTQCKVTYISVLSKKRNVLLHPNEHNHANHNLIDRLYFECLSFHRLPLSCPCPFQRLFSTHTVSSWFVVQDQPNFLSGFLLSLLCLLSFLRLQQIPALLSLPSLLASHSSREALREERASQKHCKPAIKHFGDQLIHFGYFPKNKSMNNKS